MKNLDENTGFLMLQVSSLWKNYHKKILKKYYQISYVQYVVLAGIYWFTLRNKKQVPQAMLAKHTKIAPMTISHIFKGLEAKGYIYRITHPTDIRAKAVNLTPEGKKLIIQAITTIMEADRKFFKILDINTDGFNKYLIQLLNANG